LLLADAVGLHDPSASAQVEQTSQALEEALGSGGLDRTARGGRDFGEFAYLPIPCISFATYSDVIVKLRFCPVFKDDVATPMTRAFA
jgi:hypothetical protein